MLRGFRWQLLALLVAVSLFVISLMVRSPAPAPAPTQASNSTDVPVASTEPTQAVGTATPTDSQPTDSDNGIGSQATLVTYREGLIGSIQRLNPLFADLNPVDRDITALIFEGLVRVNQYGEPEGNLAERWIVSSNGLEYVFILRQDVLWQDGTPFTATDVSFTMQMLRSPDFPGSSALRDFWRTVETEMIDNFTVRFRLTQPLSSFLDALQIGILPEHALRGITAAQLADHPFNLTPVGTGPYQLEALRSSDGTRVDIVDLRAAPVYQRRIADPDSYSIDRIRFRLYGEFDAAASALQAGAIDGLAARSRAEREQLLNLPDVVVQTTLDPAVGVLIFNWQDDDLTYFREERVRRALQIGLDVEPSIGRHLPNMAVPANSPLLPGSWAYQGNIAIPANDTDAAIQLLQSAGLEAGDSGVLFSFSILTPEDPVLVALAEDIARQWSELGIAVTVESASLESYQSRLESGDFDAVLVEISLSGGSDPDVYSFWHEGQYPDGLNYGGVDDRQISELLELARRDPSGINRSIHYRQFQIAFMERAIALPLYYPLYAYAIDPRVTNVQLGYLGTPDDRFNTLASWRIE